MILIKELAKHFYGSVGLLPSLLVHPKHSLYTRRLLTMTSVDDARQQRVKSERGAAKHLGTIEVKVDRAIYRGLQPASDCSTKPKTLEFAEKSLKGKAISHGVS